MPRGVSRRIHPSHRLPRRAGVPVATGTTGAEWVLVFESSDALLVNLAQTMLDAGIPYLNDTGRMAARLIVGEAFPHYRFLTPVEYRARAEALLASLDRMQVSKSG